MLKLRILPAFCLAFIAVIAAFSHDGASALANSTNLLASSIKVQHLATSRQIPSDSVKRVEFRVGGEVDPLGSEKARARRHNGKEMMHIWARQNSTPSTDPSGSLATVTITRTTFVEVASETQVLVSTLLQTLTFVDPILVTETSTITVSPRSSGVAKRHVAAPMTSADHQLSALDSVSSPATATSAAVSPVAVRRQVSNEPVTGIDLVSVITIETTVTLTRTGSFVSTATVVNPVFVSVTATPTVTTTRFVTAIVPTQTPASGNQETSTGIEPLPTSTVASSTIPTALSSRTSFFLSQTLGTETLVLTTGSATSSTVDPKVGVTTWFSWDSDDFTFTRAVPTSTTTQITTSSTSSSTTVPPSSGSSSEPALSPAAIAGIALGATAAVIFLLLALWLLRQRRSKRRQHVHIPEGDYQMTTAAAAAAIMDAMPPNPAMPHDRSAALASEASGNSSLGDEVRVIIQPTVNRRTQSSSLFPVAKTWPRPPGYTGDTYSFSADGSGQSTPQEPKTWSNASEYGGSSNREGVPGSGALGSAATYRREKEPGTKWAVRNEF